MNVYAGSKACYGIPDVSALSRTGHRRSTRDAVRSC